MNVYPPLRRWAGSVLFGTALATAALGTLPAAATVTPDFTEVTLEPGESTVINKRVTIPAIPGKVDVALVVDLSGSYGDDLPNIRAQLPMVYDQLVAAGVDVQFGLASFVDFPRSPWGVTSDYAYQRELDLTTDRTAFVDALNNTILRNGNDVPESQYEAMFQVATGAGNDIPGGDLGDVAPGMGMSFRDDAVRIVIITTDAPFHTPNDSMCFSGQPGCPFGYPGASRDATVAALIANNIQVIALKAPGASTQMDDLALSTGGSVQATSGNSANIGDAILEGLSEIMTTVTPAADGMCPVELAFEPASITFPSGGGEGDFAETVTVPEGTTPGSYTCMVSFGAAGTQTLVVNVPDPQLETQLDAQALITSTTRTSLLNLNTRATVRFEATLTAEGNPVPGKPIVFTAGSQTCTGTTGANGMATCGVTIGGLLSTVLNLGFEAEFAGDEGFFPSSDTGGLLRLSARLGL